MKIRKSDGTLQAFNKAKLERALDRARVRDEAKQEVMEQLPRMIRPGTSTQQIHTRVLHMLEQSDPVGAARYNLKHSMFQLGPSGYPFEQYVSRLLEAYGWKTQVSKDLPGKCVQHEIDVYAEREDEVRAIEVKYRNRPSGRVDVKVALYVHARHQDLAAQNDKIEGALFTNTQFTESARLYGECVGMKMKGWNYPKGDGIAKFIEQKHLYPITVFTRIPKHVVRNLSRDGIILASQLCKLSAEEAKRYGLKPDHFQHLQADSKKLCALNL